MSPGRQGEPERVTGSRDFVRFWVADGVSNLGTFVSTLALQLLLIDTLHADQRAIGLVRSAQWLPYLLFGLLAGVVVDRVRRRPLLVVADLVSAALLGAVGVLALAGRLSVPLLAGLVFVSGSASMFFVAAHQSYLPALVPLRLLPTASARLEQTWTAAQSVGPLVGGVLVRLLSAPVAVLVDALSYAVSAVLLATIRTGEPAPERLSGSTSDRPGAAAAVGRVVDDLREGAGWVYRHEMLAPYAVALHLWFFFNAVVTTVFVYFAATELGLDAVSIGIALAATGLTGVIGAGLAPRLGERFGLGRVVTASEWLSPAAYALLLLAQPGPMALLWPVVANLVFGLGLGLKGPLEGSYRTAVTPERLRGRMNATIRSFNWGSIAVAAPLAGVAATAWGNRLTIGIGVLGLLGAALLLNVSAYRRAELPVTPMSGGPASTTSDPGSA
ncbi:MAG: transporter [Humibacillus sp.]|nr:transporter [Humibacillus sp.]